jgi:hypothetical protein
MNRFFQNSFIKICANKNTVKRKTRTARFTELSRLRESSAFRTKRFANDINGFEALITNPPHIRPATYTNTGEDEAGKKTLGKYIKSF